MQDHDYSHTKRQDMHERRCTLENDSIGNLNIPCIAIGYEACRSGNCRRRAYQGAQRHRRLFAYTIELAKSHGF